MAITYHQYTKLGNDAIDTEHEELCLLLNQVSELVFNKLEDNTIIQLLSMLIEKTALHFSQEEQLINQTLSEPEIKLHLDTHVEALSKLIELKNLLELDIIKYQMNYTRNISNITSHLFNCDSLLVDKINRNTNPLTNKKSTNIEID